MRITALFITAAAAFAQPAPEVLLRYDFEAGLAGWNAMGSGGGVRIAGDAHSGQGALALTYEIKPRQIAAAVVPAPPSLARMRRLRFWLKIDHASPVGVLLSEQKPGGGNYIAWVSAPANTWQQIDLTPADFLLADGPQDPKDADGKLDLDQLQGIGILDLAEFFPLLSAPGGSHTLWIDDFEVLGGPAPEPSPAMLIDAFDRPFLSWITTTGIDLKLASAQNPLGEPAMEASYEQQEDPFPLLIRRLGASDLSQASRIEFDIASEQESTLGLAFEMKRPGAPQGPRFNLPIYPPGKREVFRVSIKLEDFQGPGKLDPAQFKTMFLTDTSAAGNGSVGRNTIWIGNVRFR